MVAFAQWVVLSAGWPRRLLALLSGAVGALALAPVNVAPAMLVPMIAAVWLIDGSARAETGLGRVLRWRSCLAAAGTGWWWGFGYFLAGLWWLGAAFLVEPDRYLWALPLGVLAVPAGLALFPALGFAIAGLLWSSSGARIVALAAGLGLSEWLRGWVLTGFPWNAYGMAFAGVPALAQSASAIGLEGLTLLTVLLCAAPATLADPAGTRRRAALPTGVAALVAVALLGFGAHRLDHAPIKDVPGVHLRILQPDIPQDDKFSYAEKDEILANYLALSNRSTGPDHEGLKDVTHLIWPESPFPFILSRDADALSAIAAAIPDNTVLITGAARAEQDAELSGHAGRTHYFNAIQVLGPGATILDSYDKVHLVPFGEYLPVDGLLRSMGLTNFVHIPGGFDAGSRRRLLEVPGLPPVAPQICYEAIFPGAVLPEGADADKAGVMLNVTNDGWFGRTAGPYQHLAQARLRTIEEGLPLIRAANTGISAIIDPYGRITASLPLGATGVLDGGLPRRIPPTLFARHWEVIQPALYAMAFAVALLFAMLRRR